MGKYQDAIFEIEWIEKSREIKKRDNFQCQKCGSANTLQVHHKYYVNGRNPWEYPNDSLITLCNKCHTMEHYKKTPPIYTQGQKELIKIEDYKTYQNILKKEKLQKEKLRTQNIERNIKARKEEAEKLNNPLRNTNVFFTIIGFILFPFIYTFRVLAPMVIGISIGMLIGFILYEIGVPKLLILLFSLLFGIYTWIKSNKIIIKILGWEDSGL